MLQLESLTYGYDITTGINTIDVDIDMKQMANIPATYGFNQQMAHVKLCHKPIRFGYGPTTQGFKDSNQGFNSLPLDGFWEENIGWQNFALSIGKVGPNKIKFSMYLRAFF